MQEESKRGTYQGLSGREDLCQSASEQLDEELEARAALELRTKEVAEYTNWEEDGGDSSGVLSVRSTLISLDYLSKHVFIQNQPMRCTMARENANEPKRIPLRALMTASQVDQ